MQGHLATASDRSLVCLFAAAVGCIFCVCLCACVAQLERSSVEAVWESGTGNRGGDRERSLTLITHSLGLRQRLISFSLFFALSFCLYLLCPSLPRSHQPHNTHTPVHTKRQSVQLMKCRLRADETVLDSGDQGCAPLRLLLLCLL